jgi:hypothetical protein
LNNWQWWRACCTCFGLNSTHRNLPAWRTLGNRSVYRRRFDPRLRAAGVLVMWISRLDANRVEDVAAALQRTGLDPTGRDPILLTLGDGDRKQSLRQQAAESACVIAIAGDRREDFDELFGYLRDPAGAANFDTMIGSGWFLVPDALAAPGESPQEDG